MQAANDKHDRVVQSGLLYFRVDCSTFIVRLRFITAAIKTGSDTFGGAVDAVAVLPNNDGFCATEHNTTPPSHANGRSELCITPMVLAPFLRASSIASIAANLAPD